MTDSAGTPPEPEDRAGAEQPPPAPGTPSALDAPDAEPATGPETSAPEAPDAKATDTTPAPTGAPTAPEAPDAVPATGPEAADPEARDADPEPEPEPEPAASEAAPSETATAGATGSDTGTGTGARVAAAEAEGDAEADGGEPVEPRTAAPEADAAQPVAGATPGTGSADPSDPRTETDPDPKRRRHWLRWTALGVSVVVLAAAGTGWWFYRKLDGNIHTDTSAASELDKYERDRPVSVVHDAENLLLIGSDSRAGNNSSYGRDDGGSQRSDTTILLHLAADRLSATAVSLPRDLMADLPACGRPDGTTSRAQFAQFNSAFEIGGAACTIRTVEKMTGVRIDHHMVVDFSGFKDMVDAVDGVEVCLKEPVDDRQAHLKLPAGRQTLHGEQALGFVRSRHGFGDGSDTQRMDRQQQFLGSLVKKVQSNGVLLNPTRLYPVLDAATKSLTTDPGLNTLKDLYDLVSSMRGIPTENIRFLTVPRQPYVYNGDRDELVQPDADRLFQQLRDDRPIKVAPAADVAKLKEGGGKDRDGKGGDGKDRDGDGKPDDPGPTPSPSAPPVYSGTDAASGMCG
ncbi:LCP family protein [Streptomyces sp. NPDC006530]|uniref:LCP family protein n=1 Tax=Streptomyces sp. NPDC006530 TaxID=3364750 RepID=UPI00368017B1